MKKLIICFQVILLLLVSTAISKPALASEKPVSNILIVYSQHYNFEWTEQLHKGISTALASENTYFYVEYLNELQLSNTVTFDDLFNSMYAKYKNVDFDCVIVADNYAYNFMAKYYGDAVIRHAQKRDMFRELAAKVEEGKVVKESLDAEEILRIIEQVKSRD